MLIRPATPEDAVQLCDLWNPWIEGTTITFGTLLKTPDSLAQSIAKTPFFVAQAGEALVGLATYSSFRSGVGYAHTAEHTIVLAPEAHGTGVAEQLMMALENHAKSADIRILIAGISGENEAAIAFHSRVGFTKTGHMPRVGRKFDRWLDLVLMQKSI